MISNVQPLELKPWQRSFYEGDRLQAEVALLATTAFIQRKNSGNFAADFQLLQKSYGVTTQSDLPHPFGAFQESLAEPQNTSESRSQYLLAADCPDALLYWVLFRHIPLDAPVSPLRRLEILQRTVFLLQQRYPKRPDLLYQLFSLDPSGFLLRRAPQTKLSPSQCYSRAQSYLLPLQASWVQGRYEEMWLSSLKGQIDGRQIPLSDHHIRGLSIIGEADRCLELFQQLYNANPHQFQLGSISNMMFMALGCEQISRPFVAALASNFESLAQASISELPVKPALPTRLEVKERP